MSLDASPLLNAENAPISQTQDKHIAQFNSLNKIMASLADYYQAVKSGDAGLITSLREDFNTSWIVGSDRIVYSPTSLEATITSYFGSTVTEPDQRTLIIPVYNGALLDSVLEEPQGLLYIQTLFNTIDNADELKKTLYDLSGKASNQTKVWTPDQANRKSNPNRAAFLVCSNDIFHILGYFDLNFSGRSRGVSDSPAGAALVQKHGVSTSAAHLSPEFKQGIDTKNKCVYLSNIQEINNISKYDGIFFFHNHRFVYSMTSLKIDDDSLDTRIGKVLVLPINTSEKLGNLEEEFHPVYAHLQKYEKTSKGFSLIDDAESFAEPQIQVKP